MVDKPNYELQRAVDRLARLPDPPPDPRDAKIKRLRAALETARRDIFLMSPKEGSRSPLRKFAEEAVGRIEVALCVEQSGDGT